MDLQADTCVLEEHTVSIFRAEDGGSIYLKSIQQYNPEDKHIFTDITTSNFMTHDIYFQLTVYVNTQTNSATVEQ
jgi:hypothetical protein